MTSKSASVALVLATYDRPLGEKGVDNRSRHAGAQRTDSAADRVG
jgi:hypothetical protein